MVSHWKSYSDPVTTILALGFPWRKALIIKCLHVINGGKYIHLKKPDTGQTLLASDIDSLDLDIGYAHGMIWAYNSLFVAVNREWKDTVKTGSGIYRLEDTNADGILDRKTMLVKLDGEGEHGPHSFVLHPEDGSLYFIAGNHTEIPETLLENSLVPTNWAEDNLLELLSRCSMTCGRC